MADFINKYFTNIGEELATKFDPDIMPIFEDIDSVMDGMSTNREKVLELCKKYQYK